MRFFASSIGWKNKGPSIYIWHVLHGICVKYSAGKKKRTAQKGYFGAQKNYLFIIFFFSCLKIVFCELMLLDFSDLLGSFLLRNFFIAARSIFSCKYFSCFIQYIWRFRNQLKICLGGWLGRWHGRIDNKAISAFK